MTEESASLFFVLQTRFIMKGGVIMTLKCYFLQCTGSQGGVDDLVHTYPGVDGKLIECFQVDYGISDIESGDSQTRTAFMFNLQGIYHWNGNSLVQITDQEKLIEYQYILNNLGNTFIVED